MHVHIHASSSLNIHTWRPHFCLHYFCYWFETIQINLRNKIQLFFLDMNSKHFHYIDCTIDENKDEISCNIKQINPSNQTHTTPPPPLPTMRHTHYPTTLPPHTVPSLLRVPQIGATDKQKRSIWTFKKKSIKRGYNSHKARRKIHN